MNWPRFLCRIS
jgi:hypothetical protein